MSLKNLINYLDKHCFDEKESIFPFTLILNSLSGSSSQKILHLRKRIVDLLLKEMNADYSFNYWFKNSYKYSSEVYPNDLDDTFCAWLALFNYDHHLLDRKIILGLSQILLLNQKYQSGPYFTWHLNHSKNPKWNELDFVVNLNIARFLKAQKINLLGLNKFIDQKIIANDFSSIYYKGELASIYFLSYFYHGDFRQRIKEKIKFYFKQKINDSSIILLFIAVIRFNFQDLIDQIDLQRILSMQNSDGSFPAFDFYKYNDRQTGTKFYSSQTLSSAFFLEFFLLVKNLKDKTREANLRKHLLCLFEKKVAYLKNSSIEQFLIKKASLVVNNQQSDFAIFLAHHFVASLKDKNLLMKQNIINLSLINVFAWIAYTIYDNINDEQKDLQELPLANLAIQLLYKSMFDLPDYSKHLKQIIDYLMEMEKNNFEEIDYYRFNKSPWLKLSNLSKSNLDNFSANKAKAQIFSIYFLLNYLESADHKIIISIFRLIVLTKQMSDDLHDCFRDLLNGQINSVNYYLLLSISGFPNKDDFLKNNFKDLKIIFYKEIIPMISKKILKNIKKANYLLTQQKLLKENNFFKKILSNQEIIIKEGLKESSNLINYFK